MGQGHWSRTVGITLEGTAHITKGGPVCIQAWRLCNEQPRPPDLVPLGCLKKFSLYLCGFFSPTLRADGNVKNKDLSLGWNYSSVVPSLVGGVVRQGSIR